MEAADSAEAAPLPASVDHTHFPGELNKVAGQPSLGGLTTEVQAARFLWDAGVRDVVSLRIEISRVFPDAPNPVTQGSVREHLERSLGLAPGTLAQLKPQFRTHIPEIFGAHKNTTWVSGVAGEPWQPRPSARPPPAPS